MTIRNLLFLSMILVASSLGAMSPEYKQLYKASIQNAQNAQDIEHVVKTACDGQMRVQFGYTLLRPTDTDDVLLFYTTRPVCEKVPQIELDLIQILNECLANDVYEHRNKKALINFDKYQAIPSLHAPFAGTNAAEKIQGMISVDGLQTKRFLAAIDTFRKKDEATEPAKLKKTTMVINKGSILLIGGSIVGMAVLYALYRAGTAKKEANTTKSEDEKVENDENETPMKEAINVNA